MPLKSGRPGTPLSGSLEDASLTAAKSCNRLACLAGCFAEWRSGTARHCSVLVWIGCSPWLTVGIIPTSTKTADIVEG
jgi:hypothetical protein